MVGISSLGDCPSLILFAGRALGADMAAGEVERGGVSVELNTGYADAGRCSRDVEVG